jgi:hypothetical protein
VYFLGGTVKIKDVLANFFREKYTDDDRFDLEYDLENERLPTDLLNLIEAQLQAAGATQSNTFVNETIDRIRSDFEKRLRSEIGVAMKAKTQVLNLLACAYAFSTATRQKDFSRAYDWFLRCLGFGTAPDDQREVLNVLSQTILEAEAWASNETGHLATFLGDFYYLERSFGGFRFVADSFLDRAAPFMLRHCDGENIEPLLFVVDYASNTGHSSLQSLCTVVRDLWNSDKLNARARVLFALSLSGPTGLSCGFDSAAVADEAIRAHRDKMYPQEFLQLYATTLGNDHQIIISNISTLVAAIRDYLAFLAKTESNVVFERERMFGLIARPLLNLARAGETEAMATILNAWYGGEVVDHRTTMFLVPASAYGVICAVRGSSVIYPTKPDVLLNVTMALNELTGTNVVYRFDENFTPSVGRELGVPSSTGLSVSSTAEKALEELYDFRAFEKLLVQSHELDAIRVISSVAHPIQALMVRQLGFTFGIGGAHAISRTERPFKKGVLLVGDSIFAPQEAEAIVAVLKATGIDVDRRDVVKQEDFLQEYARTDVDFLWVIGHGELRHSPDETCISLSPDCMIPVNSLPQFDGNSEGRRLLVLSVCYSGSTAQLGGIENFGIAGRLASRSQSVVGFLWAMESLPSQIFSVLIAGEMITGALHNLIFTNALKKMIEGQTVLLQRTSELLGPANAFATRLAGTSINWSRLYVWGAPVLFV